jgi:hypothetical protein
MYASRQLFPTPTLLTIRQVLHTLDPTIPVFRKCLGLLGWVCGTRGLLPKSCTISGTRLNTGDQPFASGALADMHEGILNGSKVCVEKVRMYSKGDPRKVNRVRYPSLQVPTS